MYALHIVCTQTSAKEKTTHIISIWNSWRKILIVYPANLLRSGISEISFRFAAVSLLYRHSSSLIFQYIIMSYHLYNNNNYIIVIDYIFYYCLLASTRRFVHRLPISALEIARNFNKTEWHGSRSKDII